LPFELYRQNYRLFKVMGSRVHCKSGIILEMVLNVTKATDRK